MGLFGNWICQNCNRFEYTGAECLVCSLWAEIESHLVQILFPAVSVPSHYCYWFMMLIWAEKSEKWHMI